MHSDEERYLWASYHLFILLSSLIGDTLILTASFNKDAFKINKFIATIIQHIAISDLICSILVILPETISLFADSWILGDVICHISAYARRYSYLVSVHLIAVLATSKCLLLRWHQHNIWSTKNAHVVCCVIWMILSSCLILMLVLETDGDVYLDLRIYNCNYWGTADAWTYVSPVYSFLFLFVPNLIIIGTAIPTLKYLITARISARRVRGTVPWQGAMAVTLTTIVFCISTLPTTVYHVGVNFFEDDMHPFRVHFYRISFFLAMINLMSNFYIYTLTITSYQKFLLLKVRSIASVFTSNKTSQET